MLFALPTTFRQTLRELGFAVCFIAGYLVCWLIHSNADLREDKKELTHTVVAHQKADVVSTDNSKQQQKFQTTMAKKGPEYVQAPSKPQCDATDAEFNKLHELVTETNAFIDADSVREATSTRR